MPTSKERKMLSSNEALKELNPLYINDLLTLYLLMTYNMRHLD